MADESQANRAGDASQTAGTVEMPEPTIAPLVLSLGITVLALGFAMGTTFVVVGAVILFSGLGIWIAQLLPGRGHVHEHLATPPPREQRLAETSGGVEQLQRGMPGYRLRLPVEMHPISAGVRGGIIGGLVMPVPAFAYGLLSGHGIWWPVNLLAGIALPGVDQMSIPDLEQFHPTFLALAAVTHAVVSVVLGLLYGVLMPTLPEIPRPLAWGGLLMPLLWTAVSFSLMKTVDPALQAGVDWPWFILSQFIFGVVAALVVMSAPRLSPVFAGLFGGIVGGLLMPVPALLWGLGSGQGIWYPVNLLAAMLHPSMSRLPIADLRQFHSEWLIRATLIHAIFSAGFGLLYGILLPKLRPIPAALAWGGLLMPLLWTATSFSLMGVVNPLLQERVDWPWFVVSQFVFGLCSAIVVLRSETIPIPPAGGPAPAARGASLPG